MKGLLKKDFYVFLKTGKLFLVMLVVLACIPGEAIFGYVMLYCSLVVSITLMAADEQCKWDEMAVMLPYPRRRIVLSRYLISWLFLLTMSALHAISSILIGGYAAEAGFYSSMALYISVALVISAVSLPVNYRFGVTKGRLVVVVIVSIFVSFSIISAQAVTPLTNRLPDLIRSPYVPLAALALNLLSIPLSVRGYVKRVEK